MYFLDTSEAFPAIGLCLTPPVSDKVVLATRTLISLVL